MKLTQLLERLEYEVVQGDDQIEVTELINDSRKVSEGSVFVCISGAVSDGHTYIEQVAEKGAAAVIVEKDVEAPEGLTVIKVRIRHDFRALIHHARTTLGEGNKIALGLLAFHRLHTTLTNKRKS